jgi:hypothetical protein
MPQPGAFRCNNCKIAAREARPLPGPAWAASIKETTPLSWASSAVVKARRPPILEHLLLPWQQQVFKNRRALRARASRRAGRGR